MDKKKKKVVGKRDFNSLIRDAERLQRFSTIKNKILQYGAYHEKNLDKILDSPNASFYTDEELILVKTYFAYTNFKSQNMIKEFFEQIMKDKHFLMFLKESDEKLFKEVINQCEHN